MGLGLTTFSPLKTGILSGKYNDVIDGKPPPGSRYETSKDNFADFMRGKIGNENWQKEIETVRKLKSVADKLGVSQSQLAVAWCLKNENVSTVIMGASKPEQVEDTIGALKIVDKLTPEIMAEIDEITGNKVTLDPARQS
jgi:aryl-alcohol dehydrogenase-like predicted oxidoreductase